MVSFRKIPMLKSKVHANTRKFPKNVSKPFISEKKYISLYFVALKLNYFDRFLWLATHVENGYTCCTIFIPFDIIFIFSRKKNSDINKVDIMIMNFMFMDYFQKGQHGLYTSGEFLLLFLFHWILLCCQDSIGGENVDAWDNRSQTPSVTGALAMTSCHATKKAEPRNLCIIDQTKICVVRYRLTHFFSLNFYFTFVSRFFVGIDFSNSWEIDFKLIRFNKINSLVLGT